MSQYVGEAYVKIIPDTRGFASELDKQISQSPASTQGIMKRSGLDKALREYDATARRSISTNKALAAAEAQAAQAASVHAREVDKAGGVMVNAGSKAKIFRGLTIGGAAGIASLGYAARRGILDLAAYGKEVGGVTEQLANLGTGIASLSFKDTGQALGGIAALGLNARGEAQAADEANRAEKTARQREEAVALAEKILNLREATAKAEGTVGTAAGRTRYELEKQLKAANAQYQGLAPNIKRVAGGAFNLNPDLSNKVAAGPTDASRASDFDLNASRAAATKGLANDRKLFAERQKFLKGQIKYLEKAGADSQAAKDRLQTLYGQLESVEGRITSLDEEAAAKKQANLERRLALAQTTLQIQAANARTDAQEQAAIRADADFARKNAANKNLDAQTRAGYALQAASDDKQIFQLQQQAAQEAAAAAQEAKRLADEKRKQMEEERRAERQRIRSIRELRLENGIAAAALTKGTGDDKKAINASIAYWRGIVRTTRGLQREQARATVIGLRGQLQGINGSGNGPAAATTESFFAEAQSQFKTYGSNISGSRNGVLSGQDARARFAQIALGSRGQAGKESGNGIATVAQNTNIIAVESVKQSQILNLIAKSFVNAPGGPRRRGIVIGISTKAAVYNGGGI